MNREARVQGLNDPSEYAPFLLEGPFLGNAPAMPALGFLQLLAYDAQHGACHGAPSEAEYICKGMDLI